MIRLNNKATARKLFNEGKTIYLIPCNSYINDPLWNGGISINQKNGHTFDHLVNTYETMYCNAESGYYAHYYINTTDQ